jgi:DNA relaxase NicK
VILYQGYQKGWEHYHTAYRIGTEENLVTPVSWKRGRNNLCAFIQLKNTKPAVLATICDTEWLFNL